MERLCLGGKRSLVMVNDGTVLRDSLNADYSREAGWLYRRSRLTLGLWASAIISTGRAVVCSMIGHRPFQSGDLRCSSDSARTFHGADIETVRCKSYKPLFVSQSQGNPMRQNEKASSGSIITPWMVQGRKTVTSSRHRDADQTTTIARWRPGTHVHVPGCKVSCLGDL